MDEAEKDELRTAEGRRRENGSRRLGSPVFHLERGRGIIRTVPKRSAVPKDDATPAARPAPPWLESAL